ncbi:secreted Ly-6 uPAR-related 1-like [Brachionus plicatilis]|uniref:Secreted Ly-6 uPAR-related 1-like n=1 Tax=Brachionus plicatilis TaxID=10195 RepID=A0A3M7PKT0_BRAPC|nr:secreted Ly-6 uPAR-related 1-like [Brachionus plicatilis]
MKFFVFLMSISLLVSLVPTSNGLQCYECALCSGLGTLTTCDSGETYCQKILAVAAGIETVTKSCISSCTEVNTPIVLGIGGGTYCCNTDGCNFGISIGSSIQLLILSIACSFFSKFL